MCCVWLFCKCFGFFFFKQKTAYEMRISDWSSDVCSSDLIRSMTVRTVSRAGTKSGWKHRKPGCTRNAHPTPEAQETGTRHEEHSSNGSMERSEERRVGKECVSTSRSRWSQYH